jgi:type I restriction enzyme M protein
MTATDIVQKLWNLCSVLRDDGVTYHEYVTELTYLLFLKMAEETTAEVQIPKGYRWSDLKSREIDQLKFYQNLLSHLGKSGSGRVRTIFAHAQTALTQAKNLRTLIDAIDGIQWFDATREDLGDLYEGLLEKNASETKSGAGQYFTPRPLIDAIVSVMKPHPKEVIQDPAAGTGGFLISAARFVLRTYTAPASCIYCGVELVPDTHRLLMMNLMLHGIDGKRISIGDTLSPLGTELPKADLILSNPPFGTKKGGGAPSRTDLSFSTSNKQFAFLQHIYLNLKRGGRAAVVVPDNVLFEGGTGAQIREDLLNKCNLHTILRLPSGIFYAQGVKTNVLFFTRGASDLRSTKTTWVFDLRTDMPPFGKRAPLLGSHFAEFMAAYGPDPIGASKRTKSLRFRPFKMQEIRARGNNLDISWLTTASAVNIREPVDVAAQLTNMLETALQEAKALQAILDRGNS